MSDTNIEQLKYPIGKPQIPKEISTDTLKKWIETLRIFPNELSKLTKHLSAAQLDSPYRKDGWTIRQVIHHCADSHHNSYTRFKWTLTEDTPVIKTYFEDRWAALFDSRTAPIELSLNHLKTVHAKWVYLLNGLSKEVLLKEFVHPEENEKISLQENIGIYAWHCKHHYAHIDNLLKKLL